MSTPAKAHEPTMEEILASIRRIITDDDPAGGKPASAAPVEAAEMANEPDAALGQDDIDAMFASFDAAPEPEPAKPEPTKPELVTPKAETPKADPEPLAAPEDLDVFELTEDMATAPAPEPKPVKAAAAPVEFKPDPEPAPRAPSPLTADRLLSASADDAVTNAFGSLANTILTSNARTLDDIVKEMLRPMLRAWLDDNLPPLVERLVKAEIERVARGGR